MGRIFDRLSKNESIDEILQDMLNKQQLKELKIAKEKYCDGDLEERLDDIELSYQFNMKKIEYVIELAERDIALKRKFMEMVLYIDGLSITEFNKIVTILTNATMLYKLDNHPEILSNDKFYLASSTLVSIPLESYGVYGEVITEPGVIDNVFNKTNDMEEQRNICYNIFDYCDSLDEEEVMNNRNEVVNNCKNIIRNYETKMVVRTNR